MNKFLIAALVIASASLAAGQGSDDDALNCFGYANYIADTFNVLRFTKDYSYHDSDGGVTLFTDPNGDFYIYELMTGVIINFQSGVCTKYVNADASLMYMFNDYKRVEEFDSFNGYQAYSYESNYNGVVIRGVVNELCVEALTYMSVGNKPITIAVYQNFLISDEATTLIAQAIEAAYAEIDGLDCAVIN